MSLLEFARVVGDCRALGNLSPLVTVINPNIDLRTKLDDFYNIKTTEWRGCYPGSLRSGYETVINKEEFDGHNQLFRTDREFKRMVETENVKKFEANLKFNDPNNAFEEAFNL